MKHFERREYISPFLLEEFMNEKYTDSDIRMTGKLAEKLDNFWFYYKWHTIIALFVIFVLTVCIAQSCSKTEYDVNVLYAGPYAFSTSEINATIAELNEAMPKDYNGDGEKNTGFVNYQVLNADQIEALRKQLEAEREAGINNGLLDTSYFMSQSDMYNSALMTGEYAILLIDETLYEKLAAMEGRLRNLSEVFAELPESAFGDYGIRFCETALYKNSKQLNQLPEDTVLCLLSPYVFGATSDKTVYARITETFAAMAKD